MLPSRRNVNFHNITCFDTNTKKHQTQALSILNKQNLKQTKRKDLNVRIDRRIEPSPFNKNTFLNGTNAPYVAELFFKFSQDSNSVDSSWANFFRSLNEDEISVLSDFKGPKWKKRTTSVIKDLNYNKIKLKSSDD